MPDPDPAAVSPRTLRFDGTINTGHLLTVFALMIGFGSTMIDWRGQSSQAVRDIADLKAAVAAQSISTRDAIKESVSRVEGAVAGLQTTASTVPTLTERIRQVENEITQLRARDEAVSRYLDERRGALDARFAALEQRAIESIADRRELRSTLDQMHRASTVNLPGSRGMR